MAEYGSSGPAGAKPSAVKHGTAGHKTAKCSTRPGPSAVQPDAVNRRAAGHNTAEHRGHGAAGATGMPMELPGDASD